MEVNLNILKLIYLLVMIVGTLVAGLMPLKVLRYLRHSAARASSSKQHKHVSLVLCLLTCFSGGVFLATCFLHLFPELVEHVEMLDETYGWHVDYPLAELLSCLGFFFLFFIEETVILAIPSMAHGHAHGSHGHEPPTIQESGCCMTSSFVVTPAKENNVNSNMKVYNSHEYTAVETTQTTDVEESKILDDTTSDAEVAGHCQKHCPLTVHHPRRNSGRTSPECTTTDSDQLLELPGKRNYGSISEWNNSHNNTSLIYRRCMSEGPHQRVFTALAVAEPERCETNCEKVDEDPPILMKSSPHAHSHGVRSITLVLALSMHSVIEGLAFGVGDSASQVTALFLSLLVHKLIVSFSVGLQLARTHAHQLRLVVASIFTLSLMSPIGAVTGMLLQSITEDSFGKDATITVLQGLAVGTFLYVTFFEVLLHERDNEHPNLLKLLVMVIGFFMIGLLRLVPHEHTHGSSNSTDLIAASARGLHLNHDHDHSSHEH